jgi:heme/copper-type cytochrome/quinol oxidase subunit 4
VTLRNRPINDCWKSGFVCSVSLRHLPVVVAVPDTLHHTLSLSFLLVLSVLRTRLGRLSIIAFSQSLSSPSPKY